MRKTTVDKGTEIVQFIGEAFDANSYLFIEGSDALIFDAVDINESRFRIGLTSYNKVTVKGAVASRAFCHFNAEAVRMGE